MTYYPKEGLITLHQSENPPITQQITEELNKPGYGEFITESELNEALDNIDVLTPEQSNKLNEFLPYNIGINEFFPETPKSTPFIVTTETDLSCKVGKFLDFRHNAYPPVPYTARITCTGNNKFEFPIINADNIRTPSSFTNSITHNVIGGNIIVKKHSHQNIVEFKDDRTTQFYGEISTPSFNSNGVNEQIGYIQQAITDLNNTLALTGNDVADIYSEITNSLCPNISNLQTDLLGAQGDIIAIKFDLSTAESNINTLKSKTQLIASVDPLTEITTFDGSIISDNITTITNKVTPLSVGVDSNLKISSNILHLNPVSVAGATFILDVTSNPWSQNAFFAVTRDADYYANHILHQNTQTTLPGILWALFKYVHNVYVYISETGGVYSNSSPAITPNFRGNLFTNGGVNNSHAKSIYYFGDKYFVLTDNGQLFTSLDLIEWSYQSQTVYNIFLGDDSTTIYAISSYLAFNSNALLQFDSSSAVLIKSQDMDVIGINSDGETTIYGYLNLQGGTNLNHNNLNNIDGGTYHLSQPEYVKVQELTNYTIATTSNTGTAWPTILVIKNDGVMEIGQFLDFHNTTNEALDYKARLYCSDDNTLSVDNMNMTKLNGNNLNNTTWSFIPKVDTNWDMIIGDKIQFTDASGGTTGMSIDHTSNNLTVSDGTLNTQYFKCRDQASVGDIKPYYAEDKVIIRRNGFGETKIVEFKNDRTTQFFGEITTPTFGSSDAVTKINTFNTKLNAVLEPHGFYQPTISVFIIDTSLNRFRLADTQGTYGVYYKGYKCDIGTFYNVTLPPLGVTRYIWFTATNLIPSVHSGDNTGVVVCGVSPQKMLPRAA